MKKHPPPRAGVQRAGPPDLALRPRQVQLRGVLRQDDGLLPRHPPARRLRVRRQDAVERGVCVVEQTVRGGHLRVPAAGRRDARRRTVPQRREHLPQPVVQPPVLQIDGAHLLVHPGLGHRLPPSPKDLSSKCLTIDIVSYIIGA